MSLPFLVAIALAATGSSGSSLPRAYAVDRFDGAAQQGIGQDTSSQSAVMAQTIDAQDAGAEWFLQQGVEQLNRRQLEAALVSFQQALAIARDRGNPRNESIALSHLGQVYTVLGRSEKALEHLQQALSLARTLESRQIEVAVLSQLGDTYRQFRQYEQAIESWQQGFAIAQASGAIQKAVQIASSLGSLYDRLGNYARAIEFHQQGLEMIRETGDRHREGQVLNNLGIAYDALGDYGKAIEFHQQSLAIKQAIGDRKGEGTALNNLGIAYNALGNYGKAIELYQQSLVIAKELGDRGGEGAALGNLGSTYHALGNYASAIEFHQQSLAIAQALNDRVRQGLSLANLGGAYQAQGDVKQAIELHQQSLAIAQEIGDRVGIAQVLSNLAIAYDELDQTDNAIEFYQQSLAIVQEIGDRWAEQQTLNHLSRAYLTLANYDRAIELQRDSLMVAQQLDDPDSERRGLLHLATAFRRNEQLAKAATTLQNAIEIGERLQYPSRHNGTFNAALFAEQTFAYQQLQQILIAQDKPERALEIVERSRSRLLFNLLETRFAPHGAEHEAIDETTAVANSPATTPTPSPLKTSIPKAIAKAAAPPNLKQIRRIARTQNVTLVEYTLGSEQNLYIWVVQSTGDITLRTLDLDRAEANGGLPLPERAIRNFEAIRLNGLAAPGTTATETNATETNATETNNMLSSQLLKDLHTLLIQPIADLLPQTPDADIVFVVQGALSSIPFAALQDTAGKSLIERYAIATAPSIQTLAFARRQKQRLQAERESSSTVAPSSQSPLLIVGKSGPTRIPLTFGEPLQPSPDIEKEDTEEIAIAQLFNNSTLINARTNQSQILRELAQAQLIHFAIPTLIPNAQHGDTLTAIAFPLASSNNQVLTAADILALPLQADLVVLSSVHSLQDNAIDDSAVNLSSTFIAAGVPSVVVPLWPVPDAPKRLLMTAFYQQLLQNPDKVQALQHAMLTTRESYPNPRDWAGFTLVGEIK